MYRIIGADQQEYGPITVEQLRQWMAENRVNGQTLIRPEQGGEWQPLSTLPELNTTVASNGRASTLTSDPVSAVIPYRNIPALVAYYLAVFSLIPCLGIPLGLAAVVLGVIGLKRSREPGARGSVHAWVGIILGGLFAIGYLVALGLIIYNRATRF